MWKVWEGELSRVFRVFLSSTFNDWTVEREHLRHHVFPELATWVEDKAKELGVGARFLPVDLRWGISEEAGKTHATVDICLDEIRRCQEKASRPGEIIKPNFLVFLGQRYGWRPVPPKISVEQWKKLIELGVIDAQFNEYYQEDFNAVPTEYVLKAVEGDSAINDEDLRKKWERWQKVEKQLRKKLDQSYECKGDEWKKSFSPDEITFLVGSIIEQEIVRGAFQAPDAKEHVHVFEREIKNPPTDFLSDDQHVSPTLLNRLKADIKERGFTVHSYPLENAPQQGDQYLEDFGKDVRNALEETIGYELEALKKSGDADVVDAPDLSCFVDRKELNELMQWDGGSPVLLYGEAGTGKSTLLSAAADLMRSSYQVFTYWIGRDTRCASGMGLLQAIINALHKENVLEDSEDFRLDEMASMSYQKIEYYMKDSLSKLNASTRIIIDAVDQLPVDDPATELRWLPSVAPVLLSTLDEKQREKFVTTVSESTVTTVGKLEPEESEKLLDNWFKSLRKGERTLQDGSKKNTKDQRGALLRKYNGRPLHLRVLFERAISLRSFDGIPEWLVGERDPTESSIEHFYNYLAREEGHGDVMVKRTLAYLTSSPFGVPEDVLLALLRNDPEVKTSFRNRASESSPKVYEMPEILWSRLYHDLEPFLARRSFYGEEYLDFYHAQFRRVINEIAGPWVSAEVMASCCEQIEGLAAHDENRQRQKLIEEPTLSLSLRKFLFRHGTANAIALDPSAARAAAERLTSFDYLMARLEDLPSCDVFDLVEEYKILEVQYRGDFPDYFQNWAKFIQSNKFLLAMGDGLWPSHRILLQIASEHTDTFTQADEWLESRNCDWLWVRASRRSGSSDGAKIYEDDNYETKSIDVLPDNRILILTRGGQVNIFDGKSISVLPCSYKQKGIKLSKGDLKGISWSDRELFFWDFKSRSCKSLGTVTSPIRGVSIDAAGKNALFWTADGSLGYWSEKQSSYAIIVESNGVSNAAISPDGKQGVFSLGTRMEWWNLHPNKCLKIDCVETNSSQRCLGGHDLNGVRYSEGGTHVLAWSQVQIFAIENSARDLRVLDGHKLWIQGADISSDGRRVISWSAEDFLYWDLRSEQLTPKLLEGCLWSPNGAAFVSDGENFLSWSGETQIRLWDVKSLESQEMHGHSDAVISVKILPDGNRAVSWSMDGTYRIWEVQAACCAARSLNETGYIGHSERVSGVKILSERNTIISWSEDKNLLFWNLKSGECDRNKTIHHENRVGGVEITSDCRMLFSWAMGGKLRVCDLEPASKHRVIENSNGVIGVKLFPNELQLLSWSNDGSLEVWDLGGIWGKANRPLRILKQDEWAVTGAEIYANGGRVLAWTVGLTFCNWDLTSGGAPNYLNLEDTHRLAVEGVRVHPDGNTAMSWSRDGRIFVWDLNDNKPIGLLDKHRCKVQGMHLLGSNRVVSYDSEGVVCFWDVTNPKNPALEFSEEIQPITGAQVHCGDRISFLHANAATIWDNNSNRFEVIDSFDEELKLLSNQDRWEQGRLDFKNCIVAYTQVGSVPEQVRWHGNMPKIYGFDTLNAWVAVDRSRQVKVLQPWQGNKPLMADY